MTRAFMLFFASISSFWAARAFAQDEAAEVSTADPKAAPSAADGVQSMTLSPSQPEYGDEVGTSTQAPEQTAPMRVGKFELGFHGYMRAPLRVGVGRRNDGSSGRELHSPPRVPDLSFTDWRYTDNIPGPWTELFFSYGNPRASLTASIASYNQTVASYRDLQSQLGINQAFISLNFPDAFGPIGGLKLTAGSFSNRYGTAGKYGAGMYETYLFGRTRAVGETLTADLHVTPRLSIICEHGVGAKLDVTPFELLGAQRNQRPEYLPAPGPQAQGSTFLHHAHIGLDIDKTLHFGAHYLMSWTPDDRAHQNAADPNLPLSLSQKSHPGRMTIYGGDVRLRGGVFGDGYLGYSRIDAKDILPLADAVEVLHSLGGWQFKNNYFGRFDPHTGIKPPDDSGTVDSVLFQYAFSFGAMARYPTRFWGNGPDLVATIFGMWNSVESDTFSHDKLKFGGELMYSPLEVLAVGGRYDLVQPDLGDRDQSFSVLSPKLIVRTAFLAHERVQLQYSRYFLGSQAYPSFPYQDAAKADRDVLMISASMWW